MSDDINSQASPDELRELLITKIEGLRRRLLDISRRNPLISANINPRSNALVRVVDELPDILADNLTNDRARQSMQLVPLPDFKEHPLDENTSAFIAAVSAARASDEEFITAMDKIDPNDLNSQEQEAKLERTLRDQVREMLGMPPHASTGEITLAQHANNNNISSSYDLPLPEDENEDGRHTDTAIQTLLLPDQLERKMNALLTKGRTFMDESGINVMRAVFGFLEWREPNSTNTSFAPLLLLPIEVKKQTSPSGAKFWISGIEEDIVNNEVLSEKLKLEFGIKIPLYDGNGSIEDYLKRVSQELDQTHNFKVRRQVVFGVFPSTRIAMYSDLDTEEYPFEDNEIVTKMLLGSDDTAESPFSDEYMVDDPEVETKVPLLVMDADSSQYSALVDVADGKNIALEGPPGTGKSQTIVNAIASAIGEGKKVLFVAEKLAALNVVRSRLESVGLGPFILPLQATRSNRSQVIGSLRERVELDDTFSTSEYEDKRRKFRAHRQELSEYIQAISSEFGNSGLTVHDILGKHIKADNLLSELPQVIRDINFDWAKDLTSLQLKDISQNAEDLANAFHKLKDSASFWKYHGLSIIDKFTTETISDSSKTLSQHCRKLADELSNLEKFNIEPSTDISYLQELDISVKNLTNLGSGLNNTLVEKLSNEENNSQVDNFLGQLTIYKIEYDELTDTLDEPELLDWGSKIDHLINLFNPWHFKTIAPRKLRNIAQDEQVESDGLEAAIEKTKPFIEAFPEAKEIPLAALKKSRELVQSYERRVLSLRSEATADDGAADLIERAAKLAEKLKSSKAALRPFISVEPALNVDTPSKFAAEINNSGLFGFLSARYRTAKKIYNEITLRPKFSKQNAVDDLRNLGVYKEKLQEFKSIPFLEHMLSSHYMAEETDFDTFLTLMKFYQEVEKEFPGIENIAIRKLLKLGDSEILYSLPELGSFESELTLSNAEKRLRSLKNDRGKLQTLIEEVEPLTVGFKNLDDISPKELPSLLKKVQGFQTTLDSLTTSSNALLVKEILGPAFKNQKTTPSDFEKELKAANIIITAPEKWKLILLKNLIDNQLIELGEAIPDIFELGNVAEELIKNLFDFVDMPQRDLGDTWEQVADTLLEASSDEDGLFVTAEFNRIRQTFEKFIGTGLLTKLKESEIPLDNIKDITEALVARSQARAINTKYAKVISIFNGEKLDKLRSNLAQTDRDLIKLAQGKLGEQIYQNTNAPAGNKIGRKSTWTQMALIENEINKLSRYIPTRDLTRRADKALLELKPCWMMSPLAVAQYIPRDTITFDLCIIDEASQMPPESAIGAIVRSKQVLIVGDTNQLPPTSFFKKIMDDDEQDEDEKVLDESILEQANATFRPKRRLRWHYRSRHSSLINFSNHYIYDNNLIVFPSANEEREGMGVSSIFTEGTYKSGINAIEAERMIEATLEFMKNNPGRSLGLVTLNQKQRDLLIDQFEFAKQSNKTARDYVQNWENANDGLETFFIKNLENVQGDERDVIFIGTVYGPAQIGGQTAQRFGPINGIAGRRRLNVLFSRAKQQIITFTSMTAADVIATEHQNPGAYLLGRWLEYSVTGRLETGVITNKPTDSDFEEYVIEQIEAMGFIAESQVGVAGYFIDIGVKHPDWPHGFILGVECDGASYHSSKSARDRDRLRQEVLEGLGWVFHRIWSTDWFNSPSKESDRLRQVLTELLDSKQKAGTPRTVADQTNEAFQEIVTPLINRELDFGNRERRFTEADTDTETETLNNDQDIIQVGDTIKIQYLGSDEQEKTFTISNANREPRDGEIKHSSPIAEAILGLEIDEEASFLIGQRRTTVRVLEIKKKANTTNGEVPNDTPEPRGDVNSRAEPPVAHNSSRFIASTPPDRLVRRIKPDYFYDPDYQFLLRDLAIHFIDTVGPIKEHHLCMKIARLHNFGKTGRRIRDTILKSIKGKRSPKRAANGDNIFWPDGITPKDWVPFRGLDRDRSWDQVPYPEQLGLAYSFISQNNMRDPLQSIVRKIELTRLTRERENELRNLIEAAQQIIE